MEFKTVQAMNVNGTISIALQNMAALEAVLRVHGELPKDERGMETYTIRQLCSLAKVDHNEELLLEYVCAFGAHGILVMQRLLSRYEQKNPGCGVTEKYAALVEEKIRELKKLL